MKIGYPCINLTLNCRSSHTFRLKNYSKHKLIETISGNLECLNKILDFNLKNKIQFFRITSDLIPFGSHPVIDVDWQKIFKSKFISIGTFIINNKMRITMHPGQYTVLNSNNIDVYNKSIEDLKYHVDVLDLLGLDASAKVQIHVGGIYGNKEKSLNRFIERYRNLDGRLKKRLIVENDDKNYNLDDCLVINRATKIPIVFDVYHDECYTSKGSLEEKLLNVKKTWNENDGLPIVHYSSENPLKGRGSHAESIHIAHFKEFLRKSKNVDFDIMLEIKDKEKSAFKAIELAMKDPRFSSK
ncbi:MAG: UV DNA damage repair endonuclease UvsE [Candidatus Thorarchaeota archaeon]